MYVEFTHLILFSYFAIIWIADLMYDKYFVMTIFLWRNSTICTVLFSITTNYHLMKNYSLFVLSFARLMPVLYPFNSRFKSQKYVLKILIFGTVMCMIITGSIGILLQLKFMLVPNNLCLPFVNPTNTILYTRVITILITNVYLVTLVGRIGIYVHLVNSVKQSRKAITSSKKASNVPLITQILVLTASKFQC